MPRGACRVLPHPWKVWLTLDHDSLSEKGYRQTGPMLPLEPLIAGGVSPEDLGLYKDLQPFWDRIGGDAVYTDAVAHVDHLWDSGILSSWADAHTLVEAHDPHPGIVEGLEGAEWYVDDGNDNGGDTDGGDDPGADGAGGSGDGCSGAGGADGAGGGDDPGSDREAMVDADEGKTAAFRNKPSSVQCMCPTLKHVLP